MEACLRTVGWIGEFSHFLQFIFKVFSLPPQGNSSLVNESFLPATFLYLLPRKTTKKVWPWLRTFLSSKMFKKKSIFQTVEKINQIIMKMFSYEKVCVAFHSRVLFYLHSYRGEGDPLFGRMTKSASFQIQDFWINKELRKPSLPRDSPLQQVLSSEIPALSLTSLAGIFIYIICGLTFSLIEFVIEKATYRSLHCQRAHALIIPFL